MAPGAFYLFFVSLRVWDLLRALRQNFDRAVLRRETLLLQCWRHALRQLFWEGLYSGEHLVGRPPPLLFS